jgi:hypothetical protein
MKDTIIELVVFFTVVTIIGAICYSSWEGAESYHQHKVKVEFEEGRKVERIGYTIYDVLEIVTMMENEPRDPHAKNGDAWGLLQMKPIAVDEVNRLCGTNFSHKDRLRGLTSEKMCIMFLAHELGRYRKTFGRYPTKRRLACSWNRMSIFKDVYPQYTERYNKIVRMYKL